jgi:phosphoribosylanthranilate isomerase
MNACTTKIKICGITNSEDAQLSASLGADALGFNFYRKSPRYIAPQETRNIVNQITGDVLKVGVFVNEDFDEVVAIAKVSGIDTVQLHGEEPPGYVAKLKNVTGLVVIKAFRVSPDFVPENILRYDVDMVLLDAFSKNEHGGTGQTFDWEIAKKVVSIFPKMFLAGGLDPSNIAEAIKTVAPYGVDACSSLESEPGTKDEKQLRSFFVQANGNL